MFPYNSVGAIMNPKWMNAHGGYPKSQREIDPYFFTHVDATGPYTLDEFVADDRIILKRNPTYWAGWDGELANRPERVVYRIVPEGATRMMMLARGDADFGYVELAHLPELKMRIKSENLPLMIDEAPELSQLNIVMDQKNPPTDDIHIRKMLAYSFPYQEYIKEVMHGLGVRQYTFIPPGMWGHSKDVPHYTFDLAKAKEQLGMAKSENRESVMKEIKIRYTPGYAVGKEGYLLWKSKLAEIGVNLVLDEVAYQPYKDTQYGGGVPILDRRWNPDFLDPGTFYAFMYQSYRVSRSFGTTPDHIQALFDKAAFTVGKEARTKIYHEIEQWAFDECPYIKVAHPAANRDTNVRQAWVKGYEHHVMDDHKPLIYEVWKEMPMESATQSSVLSLIAHLNRYDLE
jgi:peptide/nickel transport system substrate-binding protein